MEIRKVIICGTSDENFLLQKKFLSTNFFCQKQTFCPVRYLMLKDVTEELLHKMTLSGISYCGNIIFHVYILSNEDIVTIK